MTGRLPRNVPNDDVNDDNYKNKCANVYIEWRCTRVTETSGATLGHTICNRYSHSLSLSLFRTRRLFAERCERAQVAVVRNGFYSKLIKNPSVELLVANLHEQSCTIRMAAMRMVRVSRRVFAYIIRCELKKK